MGDNSPPPGKEVTERDGRSLCRSVSEDMHGVRERTWVFGRVPAGAAANRAALFRRGNQDCCVRGFCQFWFWWVSGILVVFRRATKIRLLLCPRNLAAESQLDFCGLRRTRLFAHALLNSAELAGHRRSPARG